MLSIAIPNFSPVRPHNLGEEPGLVLQEALAPRVPLR